MYHIEGMASTDSPQGSYSPMVKTISSFPRIHAGVEKPNLNNDATTAEDPFASQRNEAALEQNGSEMAASPSSPKDRRQSADEWDASKTPPSRFQQRKGSVYATPGSRDGHTDKTKERDQAFHTKVKEFVGTGLWSKRRKSSSKGSDPPVEKRTDGEVEVTK